MFAVAGIFFASTMKKTIRCDAMWCQIACNDRHPVTVPCIVLPSNTSIMSRRCVDKRGKC